LYQLIRGLSKTGHNDEIPALVKRLALVRKQAVKEQNDRNQHKLVEEDTHDR
jgi:hypothetical protein